MIDFGHTRFMHNWLISIPFCYYINIINVSSLARPRECSQQRIEIWSKKCMLKHDSFQTEYYYRNMFYLEILSEEKK